jgi:A/G-specific adenine glycosylase
MASFATRVIAWQRRHGRHDLPWQGTRDPYRIWVSEIMLQQTQVAAVVPYFIRFMTRYPDLPGLASASEDDVLALWSGLGYYSRGRNLLRAARSIAALHGGVFPREFEDILALPGVGRSTAGAIASLAFGARRAILDGNVKRVLARHAGVVESPPAAHQARLWALAESRLPVRGVGTYAQGIMDLGATLCTRTNPSCDRCPVRADCVARTKGLAAALPAVAKRKPVPRRSTTMILLTHGRDVLLEKRLAPGIWGGLWSFPETDDPARIAAICRSRLGAQVSTVEPMAAIRHGFTHFSLDIRPYLARAVGRRGKPPPGSIWMTRDEALGAAIPVPVRRLLGAL